MSEETTQLDVSEASETAGIDRATIREVSTWMASLAKQTHLSGLVDQLLPGLRDAFRCSTVSLSVSDPGLRRFRVAAYCYRRKDGRRSDALHVGPEKQDRFWQYAERELRAARTSGLPLSLLEDGSLALAVPLQRGQAAVLFGPRIDGAGHSVVTQELMELLGSHIGALIDRLATETIARTDAASGTLLRSAVVEDLSTALQQAGTGHHPVTLGIIEIDNVEEISERYGTEAVDRLTHAVAAAIREDLEDEDSLGRHQGRELMIVLPHASLVQASQRMEAIKRRVQRLRVELAPGQVCETSVSAGLLALEYGTSASASKVDDLLAVADYALLQARSRGGNHVQKMSWRQVDSLAPQG
ncbi:MAG: sensor domain-containing diguanylate cyclase [Acidobacteriota bacterium]